MVKLISILSLSVYLVSQVTASAVARGPERRIQVLSGLLVRQTASDPDVPTACQDICDDVTNTINACVTLQCICGTTTQNILDQCVKCIVTSSTDQSVINAGQSVLVEYKEECAEAGTTIASVNLSTVSFTATGTGAGTVTNTGAGGTATVTGFSSAVAGFSSSTGAGATTVTAAGTTSTTATPTTGAGTTTGFGTITAGAATTSLLNPLGNGASSRGVGMGVVGGLTGLLMFLVLV